MYETNKHDDRDYFLHRRFPLPKTNRLAPPTAAPPPATSCIFPPSTICNLPVKLRTLSIKNREKCPSSHLLSFITFLSPAEYPTSPSTHPPGSPHLREIAPQRHRPPRGSSPTRYEYYTSHSTIQLNSSRLDTSRPYHSKGLRDTLPSPSRLNHLFSPRSTPIVTAVHSYV